MSKPARRELLAAGDGLVGVVALVRAESRPRDVAHDVGEHRDLELRAVDRRAGGARERRDGADVVEVRVGEQDRLDRDAELLDAPPSRRSASSPGSTTSACSPPSWRKMKQFSATGPTVNMRTSIRLGLALGLLALAPVVERAVGVVGHRDVDQDHHEREQRGRQRVLLEEDDDRAEEEQRRDGGAVDRAADGGQAVEAVEAPGLGLVANAPALLAGRLAPGAAARLDAAGGVAAVLGAASLALVWAISLT